MINQNDDKSNQLKSLLDMNEDQILDFMSNESLLFKQTNVMNLNELKRLKL